MVTASLVLRRLAQGDPVLISYMSVEKMYTAEIVLREYNGESFGQLGESGG